MFVYLDNSATTKQYPEVTKRMALAAENYYGNPSSLHTMGVEAEKRLREARKMAAKGFGASENEIIFTSGGTESDNTAIFGAARKKRRDGNKIITSKVEHPAVLEAMKRLADDGFQIEYIGVDSKCRLDMEQLKAAVDDKTILISIMMVNNETGTLMPVREIAKIKGNALFHVDAVQAFGKVDISGTGADLVAVSGHKIHGPKGVGALYIKNGTKLPPFIVGGGQEDHMRSGTENIPGIVGFAKACAMSLDRFDERNQTMKSCRDYLLAGIRDQIGDIIVNSPDDGAASVLNVSFLGTRGEVILHTLEQSEIYVSTGSACASNKKGQSHVLTAMGLRPQEIEGALRFSFCEFNTIEEMDYVIDRLKTAVVQFRKLGSFR